MKPEDRAFIRRVLLVIVFGLTGTLVVLSTIDSWGLRFPDPSGRLAIAFFFGGGVPTLADRLRFGAWIWEYR